MDTGKAMVVTFLSIQAQDFIEDDAFKSIPVLKFLFLSIQAQDFIEEPGTESGGTGLGLSNS